MATNDLSNFYQEYSYGSDNFQMLMDFYEGLFIMLHDMMNQTVNNVIVPRVGVYYYVPIQLISVGDAAYDLTTLLIDSSVVDAYNLSGLSMAERTTYWSETLPLEDKIDILNVKKKYIFLETAREGSPDKRNYDVVDLKLETTKGKPLIRNIDYVLRENKIYIVKDVADYYNDAVKLIAKDIAIDYRMTEKIIGSKVFTAYTEAITKNEYRDIVQSLLYVGLGGPIVSTLNETLNTLTGLGLFKIIDYPGATGHYASFWDQAIRGNKALDRFDFLIMAPPDVTNDSGVLSMITDYMNLTKLAYTNFYISPYIDLTEKYRLNQLAHHFSYKFIVSKKEQITALEKKKFQQRLKVQEKKLWPTAKYPPEFINPSVSDVLKYMNYLKLKQSKKLSDKITASEKRKMRLSFEVLNASQKSDKINVTEKAKKKVTKITSDAVSNIGTLLLTDNGQICDCPTDVVIFDANPSITIVPPKVYYDTITVKLIKKH